MIFRNKLDIENKIIVYINEFGNCEAVAISKTYKEIPNTVLAVPYSPDVPITLDSTSFLLTIQKEQEKASPSSLEKRGDWFSLGEVSKEVKEKLKEIAQHQHLF